MTGMIPRHTLLKILEAGTWAPSGDNCQPWRFEWDGNSLLQFNVPERDTSIYNSGNRASYIAHGALLENMGIAARLYGYGMDVSLFPKGREDCLVAAIGFRKDFKRDIMLSPFITKRQTNRNAYQTNSIPKEIFDDLLSLPDATGNGELHLTRDYQQKRLLAKAASINDRILFESRELHRFLFEHIRWSKSELTATNDGMPLETMGLNRVQAHSFKLLRHWRILYLLNIFGLSRIIPFQTYQLCTHCSAMGLIQVSGNTPADFVAGGRLMQKIWLTATKHGLAFQPAAGITFLMQNLNENRIKFSEAHQSHIIKAQHYIEGIFPINQSKGIIMLFRLGYAPALKIRTPRRPVDEILQD